MKSTFGKTGTFLAKVEGRSSYGYASYRGDLDLGISPDEILRLRPQSRQNIDQGIDLHPPNPIQDSFASKLGLRDLLDLLGRSAPAPGLPLYQSFLRMIDFIAGMTDSYATEMAGEMTGRSSPV